MSKYLFSQLHQKLDHIDLLHANIGTSPKEKDEQNAALYDSILQVVDQHTDRVSQEKQALHRQIATIKKEIASYKQLMGEYTDDTAEPKAPLRMILADMQRQQQITSKVRYYYISSPICLYANTLLFLFLYSFY